MIQDSVNQMLGVAGLVGGFGRKQRQETGRLNLESEFDVIGEEFDKSTKDAVDPKTVERIGEYTADIANKTASKYGGPFGVNKKDAERKLAELENRMGSRYSDVYDFAQKNNRDIYNELVKANRANKVSNNSNNETIRKTAMQTAAQEAITPQKQSSDLANLLNELKGLTNVSSRVANNSTKKDLTELLKKYEGGK